MRRRGGPFASCLVPSVSDNKPARFATLPARPEIFVSATSKDLKSCRQLVRDARLTLGCVPITQDHFASDSRTVREMLRARVSACDAVIHLAGMCHGYEPQEREPDEPHR